MKLSSLQAICDDLLHAVLFRAVDDQNGVFLPSDRPVHRLGLALEPFPGLESWLTTEGLDALFLHRPWRLSAAQRALLDGEKIGVLAYHLAFDERLTTGFNPTLAAALAWGAPVLFAEKEGRPLSMICSLPEPQSFERIRTDVERLFGLTLDIIPPGNPSSTGKAVVAGAMSDALVRAAAEAGAGVYVTGQLRQPARRAAAETGLGVVAVGHGRSEVWGLHALARLLRPRLPGVEVRVTTFY